MGCWYYCSYFKVNGLYPVRPNSMLKPLQSDPVVNEFAISIKEPETVSRFLGNFSYKTTQMLREINFKLFRKLLRRSRLKSITIDIDSSVVNVEGHQKGAVKGYNPKKPDLEISPFMPQPVVSI